ncbi:hypothetical protein TeGR_g5574 [Tetraparma gracilis]|uniref:Uncharacterized protein n=1 Tax=Tetraparma gracilis TaxID=2962635 RepID=A0ABQ6ME10_9STRA|nr:hypothetical protein TeGR_g5574 [Tetraparma gracilis]
MLLLLLLLFSPRPPPLLVFLFALLFLTCPADALSRPACPARRAALLSPSLILAPRPSLAVPIQPTAALDRLSTTLLRISTLYDTLSPITLSPPSNYLSARLSAYCLLKDSLPLPQSSLPSYQYASLYPPRLRVLIGSNVRSQLPSFPFSPRLPPQFVEALATLAEFDGAMSLSESALPRIELLTRQMTPAKVEYVAHCLGELRKVVGEMVEETGQGERARGIIEYYYPNG